MSELLRLFGLRFFLIQQQPFVSTTFTLEIVTVNKDLYLAASIIEENKIIFLERWNDFFLKQSI